MAYTREKLEQLREALLRWKEALDAEFTDLNRDASIQRFEFSFELFWKTLKIYLKESEKINCNSPRDCFREIKNILGLTENDIKTCLKMADDRNFSVHTYSEKIANVLYKKLKKYWIVANKIFNKMKQ